MPSDGPPPEDFDYGEKQADGQYEDYPTIDEGEFEQQPRDTYIHVDGCGQKTTMTGDLPESVARDPTFYTKTFCAGCGEHVPVEEVEWEDGEEWVVQDEATDTEHLKNPMRFSIRNRDIAVDEYPVSVTHIEVRPSEGNVYVYWTTGGERDE